MRNSGYFIYGHAHSFFERLFNPMLYLGLKFNAFEAKEKEMF